MVRACILLLAHLVLVGCDDSKEAEQSYSDGASHTFLECWGWCKLNGSSTGGTGTLGAAAARSVKTK